MKRPVAQDILSRRRAEAAAVIVRVVVEVEMKRPPSLAERMQKEQARGVIWG